MMNTTKISSHAELRLRMMHLKSSNFEIEEEISHLGKEIAYTLRPQVLLKKSVIGLFKDREVQFGLAATGINLVGGFVINRLTGFMGPIKGLVLSLAARSLVLPLIRNKLEKFIS